MDVNVVLALMDRRHVFHGAAHQWLEGVTEWYTCPLVEHGVVRILSRPSYPNALPTVGDALAVVQRLASHPAHRFLADDVRLIADGVVTQPALCTPDHVTDLHLLALATRHDLRFATFDRRVRATAVQGGERALLIIPPP